MKKLLILISFILSLSFSIVGVSCQKKNNVNVEDNLKAYKIINGDLESGDLTGWEQEGNAFSLLGISDQSLTTDGQNNNKSGKYYFAKYNEEKIGVLTSSSFKIGGSGFITFKLGGAMNEGLTYLSVIEKSNGIELYRFANSSFERDKSEVLNEYKANLSNHKGKEVQIKLVDNSTQNYGYICFDDIITYYENEPDGFTMATDVKPINLGIATPSEIVNGDFSQGLEGWQVTGEENSFTEAQIIDGKISNKANSSLVGVLRSSPFKVSGTGLISYRLGMTENPDLTYLSVKKCGTNEEIFRTNSNRWKSSHGESTHLYYMDLSKYLGENVYLEFVDNSRSEWGAISLKEVKTLYVSLPTNLTDEIAIDNRIKVNVNPSYSEMRSRVNGVIETIEDQTLKTTFTNTFYATLDGVSTIQGFNPVLRYNNDGTVFCYTGDIHAMWLRDSSAQVLQYLQFIQVDNDVKNTVRGLLLKQFEQIRRDPYANAFNEDGSVWERKFELDSLSYPLWLAKKYYDLTGETDIFNNFFLVTMDRILDTLELERDHSNSNYQVHELDKGKGENEYTNCGLIWSGYRPSDDVCKYKFFIPGNMFVVAVLEDMAEIFTEIGLDVKMKERMSLLASSVRDAIETYGVYNHPTYGKIYAFEVDGSNSDINSADGKLITDMANIPSLISAPWLGYCETSNQTYINTRNFALSTDNEYYFEGQYASGIGDQHEVLGGAKAPWHMGIAMQGLTSTDKTEIEKVVKYMTDTTGGKYVMHEAFNADNPTHYSRDYFTWPCSLYSQLVLTKILNYNLLEV